MNSYHALSALVYDFDKPIGTSFGDIEFYQSLLQQYTCTGPMLEPAVGTGRFMIPLLEKGYDLYGFDLSKPMLEICIENFKAHQQDPHRLSQAGFADFKFPQTFSSIMIPSGTFLLMTDDNEIDAALNNFYQHLQSEGLLLFDIFLQPNFQAGRTLIKRYPLSPEKEITLTMTESEIDHLDQVTTTFHRYDLWENHRLVESEREIFRLKWMGLKEISLRLQNAGFRDISFTADYQENNPPTSATQTITVIAHK